MLEQTGEHVPAEPAHREVQQDRLPDPGADHGGGLGEVGAAAHHPDVVIAVLGEIVDDADLVGARGAQHQVDHVPTPYAPGTPMTSSRSSLESTSRTPARSSRGTSTSTAIDRMPRVLPSSIVLTTASSTSSSA